MNTLIRPAQGTNTRTYGPHALRCATSCQTDVDLEHCPRLRYQVVLAGNRFFHIKETATGRVRGFRGDHNEACALARNLEASL
ncbi:hypothetical protein [Pseudomonas sp. 6D_7.1_Bac1]|jgi:hypothetical protein|uniref:hypothetical protein n=1 Tax=Pseudomonas sp. 6D_7.1_Bac1 TaxID=2971615 RepID=UPI0021C60553|nr:hypothetical protein [Pseudomonas sp. 6D_7.1_Bac1]MCU1749062.1 hypothetical protein [Pseudomonas sp. 6D_7.1_Bac1]